MSTVTQTEKIINSHSALSFGVGLMPFPVLDTVALTGLQLNMLRRLSSKYELSWSDDLGKKLIGTLIATVAPIGTSMAFRSIVKGIPLIGPVLGYVTFPVFAAASTRALGQIFDKHFQSGGDLINFNPKKYFDEFVAAFKREKAIEEAAVPAAAAAAPASDSKPKK